MLAIRQFFTRHKRKLFISSGIVSIAYLVIKYLKYKFHEYQQALIKEQLIKEQIKRRFELTQRDCFFTIKDLVPLLNGNIKKELNVESITNELQLKRKNKSDKDTISDVTNTTNASTGTSTTTKSELWYQLKITSITRLLTIIYSNSLLLIFIRLQLNILSRREYLQDIVKQVKPNDSSAGDKSLYKDEEAFLSFNWWLINRGWLVLKEKIKGQVEDLFEEKTPRDSITKQELLSILSKVVIEDINEVLLPSQELESFVLNQTEISSYDLIIGEDFRVLMDELNEYLTSMSTKIVFNCLMSKSLGYLDTHLQNEDKLAIYLAKFGKLDYDELLEQLDAVDELDELSASVYSNFE